MSFELDDYSRVDMKAKGRQYSELLQRAAKTGGPNRRDSSGTGLLGGAGGVAGGTYHHQKKIIFVKFINQVKKVFLWLV